MGCGVDEPSDSGATQLVRWLNNDNVSFIAEPLHRRYDVPYVEPCSLNRSCPNR